MASRDHNQRTVSEFTGTVQLSSIPFIPTMVPQPEASGNKAQDRRG